MNPTDELITLRADLREARERLRVTEIALSKVQHENDALRARLNRVTPPSSKRWNEPLTLTDRGDVADGYNWETMSE